MGGVIDNKMINFSSKIVKSHNKFIILMDEVDGMSSGKLLYKLFSTYWLDRGGSTVLLNLIKKTKQPIICIANDRQHPKMRTLANHCYDIRFAKPNKT